MTRREKRQISREIAAIASLRDSDIDTSDIPEVRDWSHAVVGKFYGSKKISTVHLEGAISDPQQLTGTTLEALTSQQLIAQCSRGEVSAWDEFVRRWRRLIAAVVIRVARQWGHTSPELIDDLAQEVYLKLTADGFRLLQQFQPQNEKAVLGFIKVVVTNIVSDHLRATHADRRGHRAEAPPSAMSTSGSMDAVSQAERDILLEEIDRVLRVLASDKERTIFWLYYRQGFTAKAIADVPEIGLAIKGVESIIYRLTQILRRELTQAPPGLQAQGSIAALPLTDLSEQAIHQVLRETGVSPKKTPGLDQKRRTVDPKLHP